MSHSPTGREADEIIRRARDADHLNTPPEQAEASWQQPERDDQYVFHDDELNRRFPAIDWEQAYLLDDNVEQLPGQLSEPGQQFSIVGGGKVGKSLLVQDIVQRAARGLSVLGDKPGDPITVLYLDRENNLLEVVRRMKAFGAPWRDLVGKLIYLPFPAFSGPLNADVGAKELLLLVERYPNQLTVLDTVSRFITGKESDSDTWLELYRLVHQRLKAETIACCRLDHFGKDLERGARGSSAKNQDVDHVWELTSRGEHRVTDGGLTVVTTRMRLTRTHTRSGLGPDVFDLTRRGVKTNRLWLPGETTHTLTDPATVTEHEQTVDSYVDQYLSAGLEVALGRDRLRGWAEANPAVSKLPANNQLASDIVRELKRRLG
jgi:hypothetical protein